MLTLDRAGPLLGRPWGGWLSGVLLIPLCRDRPGPVPELPGLLRTRLWANEDLEQEAVQRLSEPAGSKGWGVEKVEKYHHHS